MICQRIRKITSIPTTTIVLFIFLSDEKYLNLGLRDAMIRVSRKNWPPSKTKMGSALVNPSRKFIQNSQKNRFTVNQNNMGFPTEKSETTDDGTGERPRNGSARVSSTPSLVKDRAELPKISVLSVLMGIPTIPMYAGENPMKLSFL